MLSVDAAQKIILAEVCRLGTEHVPLPLSLGRILAETIVSGIDDPPWDKSAMDGYAVCAGDTIAASQKTPHALSVVETVPAGRLPTIKIIPGMASKIMTGAPIPTGADAVIKVEDTKSDGETVQVFRKAEKGDFIRFKGEVVRKGDIVLKPGVLIRPYEIAVMASIGVSLLSVFRRPRVAILSTGDELVDIHKPRGPHQIYNSNGYGLSAQVLDAGGIPMLLGIAKDTRKDLIDKLKGASDVDFILISGGVSVGEFDYVKEVIADLGGSMKFWKVAMKPGKPLAFGKISIDGGETHVPVFGLPGNPVSAMVTFDQFVLPALRYAQGSLDLFLPIVYAKVMEKVENIPGRRHFIRGRLTLADGEYRVVPTGDQDSANLGALIKANGYIVISEDCKEVKVGERVSVQIMPSSLI